MGCKERNQNWQVNSAALKQTELKGALEWLELLVAFPPSNPRGEQARLNTKEINARTVSLWQAFRWLRARPRSKLTFAGLMIARGVLDGWLIAATLVLAVQGVVGLPNIQATQARWVHRDGRAALCPQSSVHCSLFSPQSRKILCHRTAADNVLRVA